jgi:murein DD-endopeptidase MepM/ murein hydrolase activator NlpD
VLSVAALAALAGPAAAAPSPAPGGTWVWPLDGPRTVARAFDPPATAYGPGHRGADLPGRPGQEVRAAGAGRISYAGLLAGRGVVVVVHGVLRTTYEPVTATVQVGQQVGAGEVIGHLDAGHAGCPRACLHWGLLQGEVYLDPVRLVRAGPSRLLPVNNAVPPAVAAAARAQPIVGARASAVPRQPVPADAPAFALRAGDAASGGAALLALVAGLLLLRRPPQPPHRPATPAASVGTPPTAEQPPVRTAQAAGLVDLTSERSRRRPEVA